MKRTDSYVFTATDLNDVNIANVKKAAKLKNSAEKFNELTHGLRGDVFKYKVRHRVLVRARRGKDNPYAHLYRRGGPLHRTVGQTIKKEHGTRFDVYITSYRVYE